MWSLELVACSVSDVVTGDSCMFCLWCCHWRQLHVLFVMLSLETAACSVCDVVTGDSCMFCLGCRYWRQLHGLFVMLSLEIAAWAVCDWCPCSELHGISCIIFSNVIIGIQIRLLTNSVVGRFVNIILQKKKIYFGFKSLSVVLK